MSTAWHPAATLTSSLSIVGVMAHSMVMRRNAAVGREPTVPALVNLVAASGVPHLRSALAAAGLHGIRPAQAVALVPLAAGGMHASDLADRLKVSRQAVGQGVAALEREGYVTRVPDPADARARIIELTPRGSRFYAYCAPTQSVWKSDGAKLWASDDWETCARACSCYSTPPPLNDCLFTSIRHGVGSIQDNGQGARRAHLHSRTHLRRGLGTQPRARRRDQSNQRRGGYPVDVLVPFGGQAKDLLPLRGTVPQGHPDRGRAPRTSRPGLTAIVEDAAWRTAGRSCSDWTEHLESDIWTALMPAAHGRRRTWPPGCDWRRRS